MRHAINVVLGGAEDLRHVVDGEHLFCAASSCSMRSSLCSIVAFSIISIAFKKVFPALVDYGGNELQPLLQIGACAISASEQMPRYRRLRVSSATLQKRCPSNDRIYP